MVFFIDGHSVKRPTYMQAWARVKDTAAEEALRATFEEFCESQSGGIADYNKGEHACTSAEAWPAACCSGDVVMYRTTVETAVL